MISAANTPLWIVSWLTWRLRPDRPAMKMAEFSHVEAGSGLDMLAAVEETPRRDMRLRYFIHALDELRHSGMFRERARLLATGENRTQAVLDDASFISAQGINTHESLFSRLGEVEFLAFVYVHETEGERRVGFAIALLPREGAAFAGRSHGGGRGMGVDNSFIAEEDPQQVRGHSMCRSFWSFEATPRPGLPAFHGIEQHVPVRTVSDFHGTCYGHQ